MYTLDLTEHLYSDPRIMAVFSLDDMWTQQILEDVVSDVNVQHTIHPNKVKFEIQEEQFMMVVDAPKSKTNNAMVSRMPMLIADSEVFESDTLSNEKVITNMLLSSGCDPEHVDEIMVGDYWRDEETEVNQQVDLCL